jgi:hypothetical protein
MGNVIVPFDYPVEYHVGMYIRKDTESYTRDFAAIAESVCTIQYTDDQLRI